MASGDLYFAIYINNSSLVFTDGRLKNLFSFTWGSYKDMLLSSSYVIYCVESGGFSNSEWKRESGVQMRVWSMKQYYAN